MSSARTTGRAPQVGDCLLRGIGGQQTRATADVSWQRKFVDPIGEVWTPFASFARAVDDGGSISHKQQISLPPIPATSQNYTFFSTIEQTFVGQASGTQGYVMPGVGLEYRYPIRVNTQFGSLVAEPIGQIIVRPNNLIGSNSLVNMDRQSLVARRDQSVRLGQIFRLRPVRDGHPCELRRPSNVQLKERRLCQFHRRPILSGQQAPADLISRARSTTASPRALRTGPPIT